MTNSTNIAINDDGSPNNWQAYYKEIIDTAGVPDAVESRIESDQALFRGMYLDLGEIHTKVLQSAQNPRVTMVYADVLHIPDRFNWLVEHAALFIVARRVEIAGSANFLLDYRTDKSGIVVLYTDQLVGSFTVKAVLPGKADPKIFSITSPLVPAGIAVRDVGGEPARVDLTKAQGLPMHPTEAFRDALRTSFLVGSVLYDQNPDLAVRLMSWDRDWSAVSQDLLGMYLRSSSLVALLNAQINAQRNGAAFVPYLTAQVYGDVAQSFIAQLTKYESDMNTLRAEEQISEQGIGLAKTLLHNAIYQSEYETLVAAQAEQNYNNALAASEDALLTFRAQQRQVEAIGIDFQKVGIPEWKRKQIAEAVFKLSMAVVTFAVGIGGMLLGQLEVAPVAAAGAAEAAEVAAVVEQGTQLARLAKQIADTMKKLKKVIEALQKTKAFAEAVINVSSDLSSALSLVDKLQAMDVDTGGADLSATAEWEILRRNVDDLMTKPIDAKIEFAKEYKVAFDNMTFYAQALAGANVAVVRAGQQYAQTLLQGKLATQQQAELEQYVETLQAGEKPIAKMMQSLYLRYLDGKSSLFAAMQDYRASFFYWALEQSTTNPKIIEPVKQLSAGLSSLTAMSLDSKSALTRFNPPPQTLLSAHHVVSDKDTLDALRSGQPAPVPLPLEDGTFANLDRVRLGTVRVWLGGAIASGKEAQVTVRISTTGNYQDRFKGSDFQFAAQPLKRTFSYRMTTAEPAGGANWKFENGAYGVIKLDGRVDDVVAYAYFAPTPFAQWTLEVRPADNPNIDLSKLTDVTFVFEGSAIGTYSA